MKNIYNIVLVLTILLSMATGVFKVLGQEADVQLFQVLGFSPSMVMALGAVQCVGAILMAFAKYRRIGGYIMIPTFVIATMAVFMNQLWLFGFVSLLFIAMAWAVARYAGMISA